MSLPALVGMFEREQECLKKARKKLDGPIKKLIYEQRFADAECLCRLCDMTLSNFIKKIYQAIEIE